jgi:Kdo2-lipid IVA lauroyltransferase/acyltransferase
MKALNRILVAAIKTVIWFFRVIPYPAAIRIGRGLADISYIFAAPERKIAEIQMKAALGYDFRPEMIKKVFLNHADVFVDAIRYAYMDDEEIDKRIKITGAENLKAAQLSGRGVMMISSHTGNWEIQAHIARLLGVEFCVMADLRDNSEIEKLINDLRRRTGATILPPTGKLLMLVRELKRGRTIGVIIDKRGEKGAKLYCDFFGMPALTNPASAFIASKGDALIVPVYSMREGYSYKITICPAVDTRIFSGDVIQSISDYMHGWTESIIRKKPERWTWTYSRWIRRSEMKEVIKKGLDFKEFVRSKAVKGSKNK